MAQKRSWVVRQGDCAIAEHLDGAEAVVAVNGRRRVGRSRSAGSLLR
jgi:hypothetical protein